MRVSGTQHSPVARISSVQTKHAPYPMHVTVCTLKVTGVKGHREQRNASAGGGGFGEVWMLAKGYCERTEIELPGALALLLKLPVKMKRQDRKRALVEDHFCE